MAASGVSSPTGVDETAHAVARSSGMTAEVTSAIHEDVGTCAVVFGERGRIMSLNPWIPVATAKARPAMLVCRDVHEPETVTVRTDLATYAIEAEFVAASLPAIEASWPAMSHADTLGNMRALDAWRTALHDGTRASLPFQRETRQCE